MIDRTRLAEFRRTAAGWLRLLKLLLTVCCLAVALSHGTPAV